MESTITKPIDFCTDEYADRPESVEVTFTPKDYDRIARVQILIKENNLDSASITFKGVLLNENGEAIPNRYEFEKLVIYKNRFYFHAQSKFDSRIQFESNSFTLEEINQKFIKK